jgi:hypothetical protein
MALCLALVSACSASPQPSGTTPPRPAPASSATPAIPVSPQPTSSPELTGPQKTGLPMPAADRTVRLSRDGEVELERANETVSVGCRAGGDLDLQADNVTVRAVGRCKAISVDGQNNIVTAEYVDELSVDGSHNSVRASRAGETDVDGSHNAVEVRAILRKLEVQGTHNSVRFGGSPRTDSEDGNAVSPFTR